MSPQEIVEAFIDAWNRGDVPAAFGMMAQHRGWHNIPMEPAVGLAGVQALIAGSFPPSKVPSGSRITSRPMATWCSPSGPTSFGGRPLARDPRVGHVRDQRRGQDHPLARLFRPGGVSAGVCLSDAPHRDLRAGAISPERTAVAHGRSLRHGRGGDLRG